MPASLVDPLRPYLRALLLVAAALVIHRLLTPFVGLNHPFFPFFVAIVVAAATGGYGPSLLAVMLSWIVIDTLSLAPPENLEAFRTRSQVAFAFFSVGFATTLLGGSLQASRRRDAAARGELRRAFEVQRAERERLEITLASIADAVITTDPEGRVTSLNRVACRLTRWSAEQAIGRPLKKVFRTVQEASRRTDDLPLARVVGDGEVVLSAEELLLIARDGSTRPVEHNAAPIRDARGKVQGAVIVFRDVSERKQAEQARRETEDRFQQLAGHIQDVFWIYELDGSKVGYVSPAYESIWGRACQSLRDRPLSYLESVHPEDRSRVCRAHQRLETGRATGEEYRIIRPDGSVRWVWDRGFPIRDELGRVVRVAGIAEDITDRKRAEQALRESEERFRTLADATPALIWKSGPDQSFNYFNKQWLDFTGREIAEELGDGWCAGAHPDDLEECLRTYHAAFAARSPFTTEYRLRRHDGEYRWVIDTGVPLFLPDGSFSGYIGSCLDITDRKRVEETLRDSDRRKEEFLAVLSHELRNPLAPIQSALDLLSQAREADLPPDHRQVAMIERQVKNLRRLVDDLLDISRISRGKIELHKEAVDLATLVAQTVDAIRPVYEERQLDLRVTTTPLPCPLEADPTRLEQVLFNLLANAAKYTPEGGRVWLDVARIEGQAVITVRDTGIGIEPELLTRVFDLFLQGERRVRLSHEGGGIGLSLARNLVELHGGTIDAASPGPDQGSEFVVRLPLSSAARPCVPPAAQAPRPEPPAPLPRWTVLIVDDNAPAADSLGILVSTVLGLDVRVAYSGRRALELAALDRPDLVLLDLEMAGMDGYEAARRLREQSGGDRPLIVAVTGWGHDEDRRRSKEAGLDLHLVKPVTVKELRRAIETLTPRLRVVRAKPPSGPGPRPGAPPNADPPLVPAR